MLFITSGTDDSVGGGGDADEDVSACQGEVLALQIISSNNVSV